MAIKVIRAEKPNQHCTLANLEPGQLYTASIGSPDQPPELVCTSYQGHTFSLMGNGLSRFWSKTTTPHDWSSTKLYNLTRISSIDITATEVGVCPF